jgi:heterodisulfide reductase subunit B2
MTTATETVGYYPGCSLHGTSREYDESLRAVSGALGVPLAELDDWS